MCGEKERGGFFGGFGVWRVELGFDKEEVGFTGEVVGFGGGGLREDWVRVERGILGEGVFSGLFYWIFFWRSALFQACCVFESVALGCQE